MIFYQPWHLAFGGIKRAKWRTAKDNEEKQGRKEKMGFGKREEETEQSASAQKRWQVGLQTKLEPLSPLHASEHAALLFPSLFSNQVLLLDRDQQKQQTSSRITFQTIMHMTPKSPRCRPVQGGADLTAVCLRTLFPGYDHQHESLTLWY